MSERQKHTKRCNGEGLPFPNVQMFQCFIVHLIYCDVIAL